MRRDILQSVENEFLRYKGVAEGAFEQLDEAQLCRPDAGGAPAVSTIAWHIAGNLTSRFTDFLETDGEKPWRDRESEFRERMVSRVELMARWRSGWKILTDTLGTLEDEDLSREVLLRGEALPVHAALLRALTHVGYHVGQIVYVGRLHRGEHWTFLSVPPGVIEPQRETG
jgi:hypothetical protein